MKANSFRLKIALLTLLLSGGVLLLFGFLFMSVINRTGYERIDRDLRILAEFQARRPPINEHWGHFEEALSNLYGDDARKQFSLKVISFGGEPKYAPRGGPANLPNNLLPALEPELHPAGFSENNREPPMLSRFPIPFNDYPPMHMPPPRMRIRGPVFSTAHIGRGSWRVVGIGNEAVNIFIAMNLAVFFAEAHRFVNFFLIALPAALLLLGCGGWLIAQRALRPVKIIAQTAEKITTRELDRRIPATYADREFSRLIDVINGMLARLEKSYQQAVRFSGDAAHELKTPLTILQGELENALQEAPADSEAQRRYGELIEEVQRLVAITRKLLLLAQADSGEMKLNLEPFCLSSALENMCEDIAALAPNLALQKEIEPDLHVMADADLMNQALHNLVSNAVKYNRKNGWIKLSLKPEGTLIKLSLSNTGEEIPPYDQERIFERFYRVSKARDRAVDGTGLGLSLAREIVLAHKGELFLESSQNGVTVFTMRLAAA